MATGAITLLILLLCLASSSVAASKSATKVACKISEFSCENGRCVPLNRYCNNVNECGDSSDEPRYCTRCNRTYYGEVGKTYDLELHRPKEDKIPFICHLTFIAGGADNGDLVQLTFDSFTLGRFVSFTSDGCPDGALQISESNRPQVGGSWCGTSWGPSIYYSETNSVSIFVSLYRLSKDQNGYNFDFRMEYKFLKKNSATVRYGGGRSYVNTTAPTVDENYNNENANGGSGNNKIASSHSPDGGAPAQDPEFYLGDLITGTYCSRIFSDCDRKRCRLQSPNFPGVYPRNLTCYYAIRQHEVLPGRHALIIVRQPKGQLISIRSQSALYGTASTRELKVWNACDDVQDYVTVYDGYTTRDPVILKFCGGGEAVPEAISSGHELLVEFSTSPYGTFLHPSPVQSLHGFQLEVENLYRLFTPSSCASTRLEFAELQMSANYRTLHESCGRTVHMILGLANSEHSVRHESLIDRHWVKFVDQQSPTYVKTKRNCEFWIRGTSKGVLETPLHSLPANTTCLYHLQGMDTAVSPSPIPFRPLQPRYPDGYWRDSAIVFPPPRYRVWLSVVKFFVSGGRTTQKLDQELCRSYLNVWDGQLWTPTNCNGLFCGPKDKLKGKTTSSSLGNRNVTMLARYCKEHIPRTCDHLMLANATRFPRPCTLSESYLSSGDSLTLELRLADATALRPVKFRVLYEFVDLHQDGEPFGDGPCNRKFTNLQDGTRKFQAPKDIFLYGRGGAKNISCVYRFESEKDEKIKITFTELIIKNRDCRSHISADTDRYQCYGNTSATVRLFDIPWPDLPGVPRDCFCSAENSVGQPFTFVSTSNVVELRFSVIGMNASDDFTTLFFEGTWKFVKAPQCTANMKRTGASGEIVLRYPVESSDEINCQSHPRVMIPSPNKYLYVKLHGIILKHLDKQGNETTVSQMKCSTLNRITVHTPLFSAIICPQEAQSRRHNLVELFSEGWHLHQHKFFPVDRMGLDYLGKELPRSIMVEFLGKESGTYSVTWLELSRRRKEVPPNGMGLIIMMHDECEHRCPELDACINTTVWCDGREDCPSGVDEALTHCSLLLQLPPLYLFLGAVGILLCCFVICLVVWRMCRRRPRSILQTRLKSLSSDTAIIDEKGVIC